MFVKVLYEKYFRVQCRPMSKPQYTLHHRQHFVAKGVSLRPGERFHVDVEIDPAMIAAEYAFRLRSRKSRQAKLVFGAIRLTYRKDEG